MTVFSGLFRLGRDAELRRTTGGEPVASMSLAYNYGPRTDNGRATQWIEASLWGKRAEGLVGYLLKGKAVFAVLEDLHIQTFEGRDGTPGHKLAGRVVNIEFTGDRGDAGAPRAPAPAPAPRPSTNPYATQAQRRPPAPAAGGFDDMDDDIPF